MLEIDFRELYFSWSSNVKDSTWSSHRKLPSERCSSGPGYQELLFLVYLFKELLFILSNLQSLPYVTYPLKSVWANPWSCHYWLHLPVVFSESPLVWVIDTIKSTTYIFSFLSPHYMLIGHYSVWHDEEVFVYLISLKPSIAFGRGIWQLWLVIILQLRKHKFHRDDYYSKVIFL